METKSKILTIIDWILRIVLGAVFIFSAYAKLYPIEWFERHLVTQLNFEINLSQYVARIIIAVEFLIGIFLIAGFYLKKITYPAYFFILTFFTFYLAFGWFVNGSEENCGCFGATIPMSTKASILKNIVLVIIGLVSFRMAKEIKFKFLKLSFSILAIAGISLPFILNPPNFYNGEVYVFEENIEAPFLHEKQFGGIEDSIDLKNGKNLVLVASLTCPHCKNLAFKICDLKKDGKLDNVYLLLWGDTSDIQPFFDYADCELPYKLVTDGKDFGSYSAGSVPRLFLIDNGMLKFEFDESNFSYDNYLKYSK